MSTVTNARGVLVIATGGNITLYSPEEKSAEIKQAPLNIIRKALGMPPNENIISFRENSLAPLELRVRFEDLRKESSSHADPILLDSSQIDPQLWTDLASLINDRYSSYEGFVILHGLDTMAYTASALSFMLGELAKPIVVTGSQRPLTYKRTDAIQNIMSAITFAGAESLGIQPVIPEVTVYSYDSLFRGNRVSMAHASSYRCFESSNYPTLADMGATPEIQAHLVRRPKTSSNPILRKRTTAKVQIIDVFPGIDPQILLGIHASNQRIINERSNNNTDETRKKQATKADPENGLLAEEPVSGILLRTYGMGTAPTAERFLRAIEALVKSGLLVVNVTQAKSGRVSHGVDQISLRLFEHGVVSGLDMTSEAAYAKMVALLSDHDQKENVSDLVQLDYAGEQSQSIFTFHYGNGKTTWDGIPKGQHGATAILAPESPMTRHHLLVNNYDKIRLIQFRMLGVMPEKKDIEEPDHHIANLDVFLVPRDKKIEKGTEGLTRLVEQAQLQWSKHGRLTINIAFNITDFKHELLSPGTMLYIETYTPVRWKRIDIAIYAET